MGNGLEAVNSAVEGFFKGSLTLWGLLSREGPVEVVAVDGGSWSHQGEGVPILISGPGSTLLSSPVPCSGFVLGGGGAIVEMAGGGNTVFGSPATLNASELFGSGASDRIIYAGPTLGPGAKQISSGSAIIAIDTTGDGVADSTLRLAGDYDIAAFRLLPHADGGERGGQRT